MSGITRGIQLIADFLKLFFKAVKSGNLQAVTEGMTVGNTWLKETVNEAGSVRISPYALLLGADPWAGSRAAYRDYAAKWSHNL